MSHLRRLLEFTSTIGVPTIPKTVMERGSKLLEELNAPSSVAEFDNVQAALQATLASATKSTGKLQGGSLREFTRFLEKEVHTHSILPQNSHAEG